MGENSKGGSEEDRSMEEIFKEIDFNLTVEKLLKNRQIEEAMGLLDRAFKWVHAAKRNELYQLALETIKKGREEVKVMVVKQVLKHSDDLSPEIVNQIYRKPFDRTARIASTELHLGGESRMVRNGATKNLRN
jgi:hypothetical protein